MPGSVMNSIMNVYIIKTIKKMKWNSENVASNTELNFPITINEVESFVSKHAKLGDNKTTSLDSIPNFVLKNQDVIKILYYLFSK